MLLRILICLCFVSVRVAWPQGQNRLPSFQKKTISLSTGIKMSYTEAGKPGKPVLILLHGYTDTGRSFYPTMDSLLRIFPDLHILAPDLRGHGDSSLPAGDRCATAPEECFEFSDFAEDIIDFMDRKEIHEAHIAGHSMGSAVAQELGLSYPRRIKSLILIGSFVKGTDNPVINDFLLTSTIEGLWRTSLQQEKDFTWPQDAYTLTPLDADRNALQWMALNWVADPVADASFIQQIIPETAQIPLGTWIGAIRVLSKFDNTVPLQNLTVPVLVLWATQDNVFPEPEQASLRMSLDQAVKAGRTRYYFKVYGKQPLPVSGLQESDLGHNTQWGAPQAVAADIAAFIRTGKPTADLPYADPLNVKKVLLEKGRASLIQYPEKKIQP